MLVFIDGFDHYSTLTQKWQDAINVSISSVGRNGTNGVSLLGNGQRDIVSRIFTSQPTWIVGAAYNFASLPSLDHKIMTFRDGATIQIDLRRTSSGLLRATLNGSSLALGTTNLLTNVYYYIEMKATIANSGGTVEVRLNGGSSPELTFTGDTQNTANASINTLVIGDRDLGNTNFIIDDVYICDGIDQSISQPGSPPNNDFLGDIRVQSIFPNGNGNSSQLIGSDGNSTDNYLLVDETTPNSDTDYVSSATVGDKDTYTYGNVTPQAGTVFGVQLVPFAAKTDAGVRKIASVTRIAGVEEDSPDKTLLVTYQYLPDIRGATPTASGWTITDINNAEFGVKITA